MGRHCLAESPGCFIGHFLGGLVAAHTGLVKQRQNLPGLAGWQPRWSKGRRMGVSVEVPRALPPHSSTSAQAWPPNWADPCLINPALDATRSLTEDCLKKQPMLCLLVCFCIF